MATGTLYLIPCTLGDTPAEQVLPQHVINLARSLQHFVVEQPKTTRQFLSALKPEHPIQSLHFATLNEHTPANELPELLAPLLAGHDVGIVSEAGCPGIADPGANLVSLAHRNGIRVIPLVGPSSILLALMASGLNGQSFAFHGYLPIDEKERYKTQTNPAIHRNTLPQRQNVQRPARPMSPGHAVVRRHRHYFAKRTNPDAFDRTMEIPACPATEQAA
jgi:16S rRNA (cytidine1402-2'-O)-methyltransferase